MLEKASRAGLKSATIYASSIGEGIDPEIVARGDALRALIARSGLTVSGPELHGRQRHARERFFGYPKAELVRNSGRIGRLRFRNRAERCSTSARRRPTAASNSAT